MLSIKQVALRTIVLCSFIIACCSSICSQYQKNEIKTKSFAGLYKYKSKYRTANFVEQTNDGGYIIAGNRPSIKTDTTKVFDLITGELLHYVVSTHQDVWIRKINCLGKTEWERQFGDFDFNNGKCIQKTIDGGYIVAGEKTNYTYSFLKDVNIDAYIIKLSNTGKTEWQKTLGGSRNDGANYIQQTADSGYIMCGYSESDNSDVIGQTNCNAWIVKLNNTGNLEWQKLGNFKKSEAFSIKQLTDGGYIVVGKTNKEPEINVHEYQDSFLIHSYNSCTKLNAGFVAKFSANGNLEWEKQLGDSNSFSEIYNIAETNDTSFILAGMTRLYHASGKLESDKNSLIVKIKTDGYVEWKKKLVDSENIDKRINNIVLCKDGGYIIAGKIAYKQLDKHKYYDTTTVVDINGNFVRFEIKEYLINRYDTITNYDYLAKIDSTGKVIWQKLLAVNPSEKCNNSLQKTNDGLFIFMGNKRSKSTKTDATYLSPYLIKSDIMGKIIWQKELD